jgi:hypothetical protein
MGNLMKVIMGNLMTTLKDPIVNSVLGQNGISHLPYHWQHSQGNLPKTIVTCPDFNGLHSNNQIRGYWQ